MDDLMLYEMAAVISTQCGTRLDETLNALLGYWQDKIAHVWQAEDMLEAAERIGKPILRTEAIELLKSIFAGLDSALGITRQTLEVVLEDYHRDFASLSPEKYREIHGVFKVWREHNPIAHQFGLFPNQVDGRHYGVKINATATKCPREEWITVSIPPIIDRDVWEAAPFQKKVNHQMAKRNRKVDYLLSGRIKCVCGCALTGTITGNELYKHRRYDCGSRHALPRKDGEICETPSIRAEAIENDVWDSIVGIFSDLTRFEQLLRIAQEDEQKALNPKQDEFESILRIIESTEQEAVEIGQALRRAEGIVAKLIEADMQEVNKRYEALCNRRDILQSELSEIRLTDDTIRNAIIFAQDINAGIQNADFETKRQNLDFLQVKVSIKGKHFFVKSLLGEWDGEIRKLPRKSNVALANNAV